MKGAMRSLDKIFAPRNIAVIGASNTLGKVGTVTLANLLQGGFAGQIYPVNPNHETVQGLPAYRSVGDLPETVDLAVVCTPAQSVAELVVQCGEMGVGGMVVLTAGFRETGPLGRALDEALSNAVRRFPRMRVIGPNCLGVIVPQAKLNASFAASMPSPGRVAFVSQSGALCTAMLDWASDRALGFSHFISTGNMLDVDLADLLDYLAQDGATDAVMLYVESIERARRFMSAARACSLRKPIVAYKAGRFAESAKAAASHTGAMAGVDSVYEAAFERAGIVRIFAVDDLFDSAQLLARGPRVRGDRLAIVTNAGGPGVMACDALLSKGGKLAKLSEATLQQLNQSLPPSWSHGNPVDVLGDATPRRFAQALEIMAADPGVDAILATLTPQAMTDPTATATGVASVAARVHKPILASWMGGRMVREGIAVLNAAGVPTADTPDDAVSAFTNLVRYGRNLELLYETPREVPLNLDPAPHQSREKLRRLFATDRDILDEPQAKMLLSAYGIRVAKGREGATVDEVVSIAGAIGYPVVLKVVSPQITHKTDVGGVALNVANEQQVRRTYDEMIASVRQARPDAQISAVSVQPMVSLPGGIELIIGTKKDPVFGPVIMVGFGGIAAELFRDRALGLPPLNERLALHMLESLRAWPLLNGYRGRKPVANVDRLVELLLRFSMLVSDFPEILELDANPVLVRDDQAIALDARIVVDRSAVEARDPRPYAHLAIRPYPEELIEPATLVDGTPLTLRPIKPEDEPLWHELLAGTSRESLWARFQFAFKTDIHEAAIRFCFVDYDRELTVVAEANVAGARRLLGVARAVTDVNSGRAEFGILVGDPWQGKGLGNLLTGYCLKNVDRTQVREIYAVTGRTNTRMIGVFRRFGFDIGPADDPALLLATKSIG
jgi:acetyltransferase